MDEDVDEYMDEDGDAHAHEHGYDEAPLACPAARALVRNQSGLQGKGMGILAPGESVLIVAANDADPMVLDAIKKALAERKVTPYIKFTYEMTGQSKEEALADRKKRTKGQQIEEAGIYQATSWITGQFPDPSQPKAWLKQRDPKVYAELFPGDTGTDPVPSGTRQRPRGEAGEDADTGAAAATGDYKKRFAVGDAIKDFLTKHPDVRGVFWGAGGSTGLRRQLYPMQDKFLGTFVTDNIYNLQSQMSTYPGDVWQLAEEQLLEPLVYIDKVEVTDPEGTNLHADITEEMAQRWAAGAYQRGHLYMFPNQATGRFGYSFVNYPAFQQKWLPREPIARIEGVLAGTQGHGGFFPRWEVYFKNGFISDVKGGGAQGAALKDFLQYPGLNELTFPYHNQPGYWYLYEIAFGSHPKSFRHPGVMMDTGNTSPERVRSGVIHWGLGIRLWHDPDAPTESKKWREFTEEHNVGVRPRLAHPDLLHDLQGAAAQRQQVGEPAREGPHDEPGQPRGARAGVPLRRSGLPADGGLDPRGPGHQRPRRLHEGLRAEPRRVRVQGDRRGGQGHLPALLPGRRQADYARSGADGARRRREERRRQVAGVITPLPGTRAAIARSPPGRHLPSPRGTRATCYTRRRLTGGASRKRPAATVSAR